MIQLFCGDDTKKSLLKFDKYIEAAQLKRPEASVFELTDENLTQQLVEELAQGQTLWFPRSLVMGRRMFEKENKADILKSALPLLAQSESLFVFWEDGEDPKLIKTVKDLDQKVEILSQSAGRGGQAFNLFLLSDALLNRDRKSLWLGFNQALKAGIAPQEIFWNLWWQLRVLLAVGAEPGSQDLPGLKPFVVQKAKRGLSKFKREELESLADKFGQIFAGEFPDSDEFTFRLESAILSL